MYIPCSGCENYDKNYKKLIFQIKFVKFLIYEFLVVRVLFILNKTTAHLDFKHILF